MSAFEMAVAAELTELQGRLVSEHKGALQRLEAKIMKLEADKRILRMNMKKLMHQGSKYVDCPEIMRSGSLMSTGKDGAAISVLPEGRSGKDAAFPLWIPTDASGTSAFPGRIPTDVSDMTFDSLGIRSDHSSHLSVDEIEARPTQVEGVAEEPSEENQDDDSDEDSGYSKGFGEFQMLDAWDNARRLRENMGGNGRFQAQYWCMSTGSRNTGFFRINSSEELEVSPESYDLYMQRVMLQPGSKTHLLWELLGLVLILYDIAVIPLQVFDPPETTFTVLAHWFIRCFWTSGIGRSFLTGYVLNEGSVEMSFRKVARRYIRTGLPLDFFLVGCDWFEFVFTAARGSDADGSPIRFIGILRTVRVIRLLRLVKAQKIATFIFERIRSDGVMLVAYICLIVLVLLGLIHVIACIWYGIMTRSWGLGITQVEKDTPLEVRYMEAFHHVLALFMGEHLSKPQSNPERAFTIAMLVFAFVSSAWFVGTLTTAMTRLQIITSERSAQFAALIRYLSDARVSRDLMVRVQRNARHAVREQHRNTPEEKVELLSLLSDPLRSEIHYEIYSPVLTAHPFFRLYNLVNPAGVRQVCHLVVSTVSLTRGDVLFSEFEVPRTPRTFFVTDGKCVYTYGAAGHEHVLPRCWLSEAVLWTSWVHRGTLQAVSECRLLALDSGRFTSIMSTFPTPHCLKYGEYFVENLNNQEVEEQRLTDIGTDSTGARQVAVTSFKEVDKTTEVPYDWDLTKPRRSSSISISSISGIQAFAAVMRQPSTG